MLDRIQRGDSVDEMLASQATGAEFISAAGCDKLPNIPLLEQWRPGVCGASWPAKLP